MSANGAASPGRWQVTQLSYRIGAIVSLKVVGLDAGSIVAAANSTGKMRTVNRRAILFSPQLRSHDVAPDGFRFRSGYRLACSDCGQGVLQIVGRHHLPGPSERCIEIVDSPVIADRSVSIDDHRLGGDGR